MSSTSNNGVEYKDQNPFVRFAQLDAYCRGDDKMDVNTKVTHMLDYINKFRALADDLDPTHEATESCKNTISLTISDLLLRIARIHGLAPGVADLEIQW